MSSICPTCPWRRGASADPIPNFDADKARALTCTVGDGSDDFRPIMACHGSTEEHNLPCGGYLAVVGYTNLAVRVGYMTRTYTPPDVTGIDLVGSFGEMLDQVAP